MANMVCQRHLVGENFTTKFAVQWLSLLGKLSGSRLFSKIMAIIMNRFIFIKFNKYNEIQFQEYHNLSFVCNGP